jgi:hypothetical protein
MHALVLFFAEFEWLEKRFWAFEQLVAQFDIVSVRHAVHDLLLRIGKRFHLGFEVVDDVALGGDGDMATFFSLVSRALSRSVSGMFENSWLVSPMSRIRYSVRSLPAMLIFMMACERANPS